MWRNPEHDLERASHETERRDELARAKVLQHQDLRYHGNSETAGGSLYQQIEMIVESLWPEFSGLGRYPGPVFPATRTRLGSHENAATDVARRLEVFRGVFRGADRANPLIDHLFDDHLLWRLNHAHSYGNADFVVNEIDAVIIHVEPQFDVWVKFVKRADAGNEPRHHDRR